MLVAFINEHQYHKHDYKHTFVFAPLLYIDRIQASAQTKDWIGLRWGGGGDWEGGGETPHS